VAATPAGPELQSVASPAKKKASGGAEKKPETKQTPDSKQQGSLF
jgi:hypothetical protein